VRWANVIKALRRVAAMLLFLVAGVLAVVALVLCLTIVLLPIGVPALLASIWLWKRAVRLLLPRKGDIQRAGRKVLHVEEVQKTVDRGRRRARRTAGRLRKRSARLVARMR